MDTYCSAFDAWLAADGPPAVFLLDPEGLWRFDAEWTRDAIERLRLEAHANPPEHGLRWVLARDRASGYVQLVLVTSPALLRAHPRLDTRTFGSADEAVRVRASMGHPPIDRTPW